MTPREKAKALYEEYDIHPTFEEDWFDYQRTGCVVDCSECFAMARAVEFPDGRCAWFISAAVGNLLELIQLLPWRMPFIAFCRRGKSRLHIYPMDRFIRRCCHAN